MQCDLIQESAASGPFSISIRTTGATATPAVTSILVLETSGQPNLPPMVTRPRAKEGVKVSWRTLVALACATFFSPPAFATPPMYFDRFDRDAGLSQLAVHAIAEDKTGYLWLGTED